MIGFINNERDRENLNFLLSLSNEAIMEWYDQSDEDDRKYAHELFDAYALELRMRAEEVKLETELSFQSEYKEAKEIIERVKNV